MLSTDESSKPVQVAFPDLFNVCNTEIFCLRHTATCMCRRILANHFDVRVNRLEQPHSWRFSVSLDFVSDVCSSQKKQTVKMIC